MTEERFAVVGFRMQLVEEESSRFIIPAHQECVICHEAPPPTAREDGWILAQHKAQETDVWVMLAFCGEHAKVYAAADVLQAMRDEVARDR